MMPLGTAKGRNFLEAIEQRNRLVQEYVLSERYISQFAPEDMAEAICSYFQYGGKRLRPAVLLFSCGAVGGDENKALPAAAAIEIFHTWTLVHDDIIDRDGTRRGEATVHERFYKKALHNPDMRFSERDARHYGVSLGILAGDVQHGWGISLMTELSRLNGVDPAVTLYLINSLDTYVLTQLVEGEVLDIQYSHFPVDRITGDMVENMLWKKTGALYEFAGLAGAMIGLNLADPDHELAKGISTFTSKCGTAFQLQDDILGIVGDERRLGKPVGSDIREGKCTTIILVAYQNANDRQKRLITDVLGDESASSESVTEVTKLLVNLGGIEYTHNRAQHYIESALPELDKVPPSPYRDLLASWAEFMIERDF
jgi:geranylgeranyl diphosphate synthase type I